MTRRMLGRVFLGAAMAVGVAVPPAKALDLEEAKAKGWIGERRDGYVGVVGGAPAEAVALADQINNERRAVYTGVANNNGVPLPQVEALAGQKLIDRAAPGQFVMDAAGRWIRK
ncbi:MAG: YdbL family protein [Alphaproteobacteria bacterium]|nr:YdbL family protein [Alphaproteobacteria bacterium]